MLGSNGNLSPGGPWGHGDQDDYQPGWNRMILSFVSGAAGAVPTANSDYLKSDGFDVFNTPMVKNGTGDYTVTLTAQWAAYIHGSGSIRQQPGTYDATLAFDVKVYAVDLANRTVSFVTTRPDTGAVINMAAGDICDLVLQMGKFTEPTPAGAS